MPFQGGIYQSDGKTLLNRLYGIQKAESERNELLRQQELEAQRRKILAESLTPAEAARTEYEASNPLEALFLQAKAQPANLVQKNQAPYSPDTGAALIPELSNPKQIPAKPASFDAESAIARLYALGDVDTGIKLSAANEKSKRDLNRWSGAVTYIEDPDNPGVTIAVQPSTQGEGEPFRRIGTAAMTPEARARVNQKNQDLKNDEIKLGLDRQKFLFNQRKFYEGPEIDARAKVMEDAAKRGASAANTLEIIRTIEPYLDNASGSDLTKLARRGGAFVGFDSAAATADKMIDQAAASLTLAAPKLGGAASDRDVILYERAMGGLASGTTEQKRASIQLIRQLLSKYGDSPLQQTGNVQSKQGSPSQAPAQSASTPMKSLPSAAQHTGRTIRDTSTGITYKSDGKQWVRVK